MDTPHDTRHSVLGEFATLRVSWLLFAASSFLVSGCTDDADPEDGAFAPTEGADDGESTDESAGESDDAEPSAPEVIAGEALSTAPDPAAAVACTQTNDCHEYCTCSSGSCVPDGFGPPPPYNVCDEPPQRACSSGSDCQTGCICSGGFCETNGFSPPNPDCHMPPPDGYEFDDTWQNWKAYTGSPQSHNLHYVSDNDWVAVYFGGAGNARFRTYGLSWGTDTKIEVYSYSGSKGPLVASNDDIGGAWWIADSKSSRVDFPVPADSAYLVRVINKSSASIYTNSHDYPSYMLEIAYN